MGNSTSLGKREFEWILINYQTKYSFQKGKKGHAHCDLDLTDSDVN